MERLTSLVGILAILLAALALSSRRAAIRPRTVLAGLALQATLAALVLRTAPGRSFFQTVGEGFSGLLSMVDVGCEFVFGSGFRDHFFAFKVLPSIIFFSAVMAILYHLGVMQRIIAGAAWVMQRTLGTSGAESMSAAANVFLGQTEAPLVVRPYLPTMTRSELAAVMTGGFATVSAGIIAAYAEMGIDPGHLLAASVISAPGGLVLAKIVEPETGTPDTIGSLPADKRHVGSNVVEAIALGVEDGVKLAVMVGAMLMVFLALVALVDAGLARIGALWGQAWSLAGGLGALFAPVAWLLGVPWADCPRAGELLGLKMATNEMVAYRQFSAWTAPGSGVELAERTRTILVYALCGFANFGSIGIQVGGISTLAPERRADLDPDRAEDLASLGLRMMLTGTLACLLTACMAGLFV